MTMKKTRRRRRKNNYFTKVHEEAIVKYALTDDRAERTDLYINYIGPAFDEMVDKIVYTYKFNNLPNIDYLKDDCKLWLITILEQYEFWQHLFGEMSKWENLKLKETERRVLEAIKILFNSTDEIEIFNKKAIYLYMREITGLNTKQIVNNLNRIRKRYRVFKSEWEKGNI